MTLYERAIAPSSPRAVSAPSTRAARSPAAIRRAVAATSRTGTRIERRT